MINFKDYPQGKGMKMVMVITADEPNDLGDALQKVVDDIGSSRMSLKGISDTFAYQFEIFDQHRPELIEEEKMTDMQKLKKAQDLLSDIYNKYGDLLKDNYTVCSNMSCADSCIIETIEWLNKFKKEIS